MFLKKQNTIYCFAIYAQNAHRFKGINKITVYKDRDGENI